MTTIDPNAPVLVTGATGYVAGRLVEKLLGEGHTVHAAVRDPENEKKLQYLDDLAGSLPGSIRYFKTDLLEPGSYSESMQGCELVFHTASPFTMDVKDPVKELIEPAQLGTHNVLESANDTPSVKRVVVTSSCAAIYGDNADIADLAEPLRRHFGDAYPFPTRTMPKWLIWLVGPLVNKGMTRKAIRLNVGLPWKADNSKRTRELGLSYRPLEETVVDFFQQMVDSGVFDD